jgi:hypothetical protein
MLPYDPAAPPKKHSYLARKQGASFAVLTLHTKEERQLFSSLMRDDLSFKRPSGPDWPNAVVSWNQKADGISTFYKVNTRELLWH